MDSQKPSLNSETDTKKNSIPFIIPIKGSLGLLALGHIGIKAWRKVRDESKKSQKNKDHE